MRAALITLVIAYVMSQFFRAFLAVLTPLLKAELGASETDLSLASGLWFAIFAAMQIPVGWSLDRIGPRKTTIVLFALGGIGGCLTFVFATTPLHIQIAMALLGIGCSPVLMSSYFICAQVYPPRVFATLAGTILGVGTLGNIAGSVPLAWAVESFGWRETMMGITVLTAGVAMMIAGLVRDPAKPETQGDQKGTLWDLLTMPALWAIFPLMFVNYVAAAGIRGLWIGPYFSNLYQLDASDIGWASLVMGLAMIAGNLAYGPSDRIFGTRKGVILVGNLISALLCAAMAFWPTPGIVTATAAFAAIGFFGASFPLIIAHGRSFFPPHLTGRGVTLLNLFGIGGVGVFQVLTGRVFASASDGAATASAPYSAIFATFAIALALGVVIYLFSTDRTD